MTTDQERMLESMDPAHVAGRIAVVGAGLVGRAWAMVFARAGYRVALHDADGAALPRSLAAIDDALAELKARGLLSEAPAAVRARIEAFAALGDALHDAVYVQENVTEDVAAKQAVHAEIGRLAPADAIQASSTSGIPASAWSRDLPGRERCLVAHPINPPHVVPLVELSPAPWTAPEVLARTKALQTAAGQVPVVLRKETQGFVVNRLQGALLAEAFRLYADGVMSAEDIDKTIRDGLGLRWSFMGPFETIDLNAPGGIVDYCARYGPLYHEIACAAKPQVWDAGLLAKIEAERREDLAVEDMKARAAWRDQRLMSLVAFRKGEPSR